MAQRGARAVKPISACRAKESTFTTTPSISYGNDWRFSSARSQNSCTSAAVSQRLTSGFTWNPASRSHASSSHCPDAASARSSATA